MPPGRPLTAINRFFPTWPVKAFLQESARGLYSVGLDEERFQPVAASPLCRRVRDLLFPVITAYPAIPDAEKPGLIRLTRLKVVATMTAPTSLNYRSSMAEIIHRGYSNVNTFAENLCRNQTVRVFCRPFSYLFQNPPSGVFLWKDNGSYPCVSVL
jgi:hypothetical protein